MDFAVGQNVVHPAHGAGEIIDIEDIELVSGFKKYYVIEFVGKRLTVRIPIKRVEDLGIREVMSNKRVDRVLNTLASMPQQLPTNFKERRHAVEAMLNSGFPNKIAEAVRELTWRRKDAHLTKSDMELLSEGRERLITEVSLAADIDLPNARQQIDDALAESVQMARAEAKKKAALETDD